MERWNTPDGDFVELARIAGATPESPRVLILHGLEGGLHSHYVKAIFREGRQRGWAVDLLIFRTCGAEPNRLPRSYHSGETEDPRFVIRQLIESHPDAPLGLLGVSLGGNVLCKFLGEEGRNLAPQVAGAVAISVPFRLAEASRYIGRGFGAVYEKNFLRTLVPKALAKIRQHPELQKLAQVRQARTIWDFDDLFTAPLHGFTGAQDYYTRASSINFLEAIRCPTLLLSAADDPFLPPQVLDDVRAVASTNPWLELEFHERGGHVGFTGGKWPWKASYYAESRALEFFAQRFEARLAIAG